MKKSDFGSIVWNQIYFKYFRVYLYHDLQLDVYIWAEDEYLKFWKIFFLVNSKIFCFINKD